MRNAARSHPDELVVVSIAIHCREIDARSNLLERLQRRCGRSGRRSQPALRKQRFPIEARERG